MNRYYYKDAIQDFVTKNSIEILGIISANNQFTLDIEQRNALQEQIKILQETLVGFEGVIFF